MAKNYLDFQGLRIYTEQLLSNEITATDIAGITGNYDISNGTSLTLANIMGTDILEEDINNIIT